MDNSEQDHYEPARPIGRRTRLRRLAALVFIVLVVGIWKLWWGTSPNVPHQPLRLERGEDGEFRPADGSEPPGGARFEFHAGELKARNSFSSSVVSSTSGNSRFSCRRVEISIESDHLLLELVGMRLVDHLEKLSSIESIAYFPRGHRPEPGGLAPDVVVTLHLDRIVESGFSPVRELDATLSITAGNRYRKCRAGYQDHLTAPIVDFGFKGELHHVSTVTGISSSSAKYKQVSENIAGEISKALAGKFEEFREKYGPLPELPGSFYPSYRAPEGNPLVDAYELELVVSHHGFMFPGESFWRLTTTRALAEILPEMGRLLNDAGWRAGEPEVEENRIPHLRASKSPEQLTVFVDETGTSGTISGEERGADGDAEPREHVLIVHHLTRMGQEEMRSAIDDLLDAGAPLDTVLMFEEKFGDDQRNRVFERIRQGPVTTARAWSLLAHGYHARKDDDAAREALHRAWILSRTEPESRDPIVNRLRQLGKKLEIERLEDLPVSEELLDSLGFLKLGASEALPAMEIGVDEHVRFYGNDKRGGLMMISVRVALENGGAERSVYALHYAQAREGISSHGYGGMSWSADLESGRTIIEAKRIEGKEERFRLEVRPSE